jgi:hypothetical protein
MFTQPITLTILAIAVATAVYGFRRASVKDADSAHGQAMPRASWRSRIGF